MTMLCSARDRKDDKIKMLASPVEVCKKKKKSILRYK